MIVCLNALHLIVPGPISELSYKATSDTSVTITWKPPKEPNGVIKAYFVEHGVYQYNSTTSVTMHPSTQRHVVIQDLGKFAKPHVFCAGTFTV